MSNLQKRTQTLETSVLTKMLQNESQIMVLHNESKKFKDFDQEDKQKLAKQLVTLSYFVGLKETPSLEALKLLVKFLCISFPEFSSEELESAFMKACSGEFGEIEHFQNFSPIYLGKIINAYENQKMVAKRNYMQLLEKKKWERYESEKEDYYKKNALLLIEQQLIEEYLFYVKTKYADLKDLKKYAIKVFIELCQGKNLFIKYDADKYTYEGYLEKYFLSLPTNEEEAIKSIKQYVRSYGKNLVS